MDKYEYNLKLDQIKAYMAEEQYAKAAEIADTINWNKVKNVNVLVKIGEIYENIGRYEDSREVLLNAYDHSPIGRTIIYHLAEVALKMEDYAAAQDYYDEFVDIAPHDNQRYVLKYSIMKAKDASVLELIQVLEEFKEQEYSEEWAYELAYLYHRAGSVEKCIDACDELILWFGDGPYVERALELKMLYQPLSRTQEEKYRKFRHMREGKTVIEKEEMIRAGEYAHDPVVIPQVTLNQSKFNTINLQEEIAKGMQQIMEATEKETVVGTMDSIKKIVEEIPYLQIPREEDGSKAESTKHIETDEEIDGSLKLNFKELLGEEEDGQMSIVVDEKTALEKQITGQMTIEEVLEEWERTKRAAETALQVAEQKKLESAKARALQEAEDIMDRLTDVLPKIEAGVTPKELLEEEYLQKDESENKNPVEWKELLVNVEPEESEESLKNEDSKESEELLEKEESQGSNENEEFEISKILEQQMKTLEEAEVTDTSESVKVIVEKFEDIESFNEVSSLEKELQEARKMADEADEEIPVSKSIKKLTEEQKAVFSYFVPVKGMENQLCNALTGIVKHLKEDKTASTGNLVIQGSQGCGKTVLAISIIKALQKECGRPKGRVGKIEADSLNKKDIHQLLLRVTGGCLIIENAGELERTTAVTLSLLLEQDASGLLIILEGSAGGVKKALALDEGFAKKFTETISVPIFNNDELVTFAKSYASELGYEIEEMAVLALYNRVNNIQRLDQVTRLEEIKDIVDGAIKKEGKFGLRKFFRILTASRYTDDEQIVLTEKDFE